MDTEVTHISEFIFYIKGLLTPELCKSIMSIHEKDPAKHPGYVITSQGERKPYENKVTVETEIKKEGIWKSIFDELHAKVARATIEITSKSPALQVFPVHSTGYKIQHYEKNKGHFQWHFDALGQGAWDRQMAVIIYLNSVAEGGETSFLHQNIKIKPVAGDAVFFPPFWTHLHCGEMPKSEDKYIITSFIQFTIPAEGKKKSA